MVLLAVHVNDMYHENPMMPTLLIGVMSPLTWTTICRSIADAYREANCIACACEWCICLLFLFPCIFLCHPCFAEIFNQLNSKCAQLNNIHFEGRPVLCAYNRMEITINTDLIHSSFVSAQAYSQPIVVEASTNYTPAMAHVHSTNMNPLVEATTVANMSSHPHAGSYAPPAQQMTVTIPPDCHPGAELLVQAPNGVNVNVRVPYNAVPGQKITVNY